MSAALALPLVSVEEYLSTSYEIECDYVDGVVVERNVGERKHSRLQTLLASFLLSIEAEHETLTYTEQRIWVAPRRYRAPDICVMPDAHKKEKVFSEPAALIVEILSEEDQLPALRRKMNDFFQMGVRNIAIVDPYNETAYTLDTAGRLIESAPPVLTFTMRQEKPPLTIDFAGFFRQLD